jgi:hypothetical protein
MNHKTNKTMKKTAVEWFYQRILAKDIESVFEQAKEMEKEHHKQTWLESLNCETKTFTIDIQVFENYYNETFKNK